MDSIRKIKDENILSSIFEDAARSNFVGEFEKKLKPEKAELILNEKMSSLDLFKERLIKGINRYCSISLYCSIWR
ncbi:MAG: hypothetical protein GXW91_10590 [Clostridiales bacterium]|nr:hypothetical protein [Clostridiales bacterium]